MKPSVECEALPAKGLLARYMLWAAALLSCCLMTIGSRAAADSLYAQVDRTQISLNETLNLTVRYEGRQVNTDPDFSGLNQFDVLSNRKSTQHTIINGTISASTEWSLTLAPRNTGQLLIPPLTLQGQHSKAITINVTEPSQDPGAREDVFLEAFVDKSEVHVQEQFIVTFRLHFNQIVDSLDRGQFSIPQARVEELPRVDFHKTIGNTQYAVAEFRYAIFADASGSLSIPAQLWTVRTTDQPGMSRFGFGGGRYKLHRVRAPELTVTIHPKPDIYPAHKPWLPAQKLEISERWSRSPDEFRVGEPITRTVTVTAEGAGPEQLPPVFDERGTADLKFYPDKPDQDKRLSPQGVTGTRTESIAIVPNRAGELQLPELRVTWWNSAERRVETAVLPARTLKVAPADNQTAQQEEPQVIVPNLTSPAPTLAPDAAAPASRWWPLLALLLAVSNLVTLVLWWRGRAAPKTSAAPDKANTSLTAALRALDSACQKREPMAVRHALLQWARQQWPDRQPTLQAISRWAADPTLTRELEKLDAQLYADGPDTVDFAAIAQTVRRLGAAAAPETSRVLQPLYKAG
jgi:hypothetical protein